MKEHKWRAPLPGEAQEENGFCEDCGVPASQASQPCGEAIKEKADDAPPEKPAHVSKRQAKKDAAKDAIAKKGDHSEELVDAGNGEQAPLEQKNLVVIGSLTVKSPSGKSSIVMQADDTCTGVWIQSSGPNDRFPNSVVSLYDDGVQGPVIGVYKDTKEAGMQMTIAIGLDANGNPMLQIPNGRGGVGYMGLSELMDVAKPGWR